MLVFDCTTNGSEASSPAYVVSSSSSQAPLTSPVQILDFSTATNTVSRRRGPKPVDILALPPRRPLPRPSPIGFCDRSSFIKGTQRFPGPAQDANSVSQVTDELRLSDLSDLHASSVLVINLVEAEAQLDVQAERLLSSIAMRPERAMRSLEGESLCALLNVRR